MVKKIAVYGSYRTKVPVKQRYWKRRKDGIKQRYWKKTKQMKKATIRGRYEFHGKRKDLYRAVVTAHHFMPRGYVDLAAEKFLRQPEKYGSEGSWIDREVES
ncbi:MAG: hypothetical protein ACFFCW_36135 [Candidatus Hodarchaeota archaeon]